MKTVNSFIALSCLLISSITSGEEIKIIVPNDLNTQTNTTVFTPYSIEPKQWGRPTYQEHISLEDLNDNSFIIHRRSDNGAAGSGIKYKVNYSITDNSDSMKEIHFVMSVEQPKTYQEGLFLKFSIPKFDQSDASNFLKSGHIIYNFEIDSEYPVESIKANFQRLADKKIIIQNQEMDFSYKILPYRNGSKALITAKILPPDNKSNTLDFNNSMILFKNKIKEIINH